MPTEPSLRERKKVAARAAMSDVACCLMVEHGLDAVTPEAVADAVGVSPRTFRNYFSSREEAIVDGIVRRSTSIVAGLRARPADEPVWDSLLHVLPDAITAIVPEHHDLVVLMRLSRENPTLLAQHLSGVRPAPPAPCRDHRRARGDRRRRRPRPTPARCRGRGRPADLDLAVGRVGPRQDASRPRTRKPRAVARRHPPGRRPADRLTVRPPSRLPLVSGRFRTPSTWRPHGLVPLPARPIRIPPAMAYGRRVADRSDRRPDRRRNSVQPER
jgi:AcrR family transcriptional regulator